MSQNIHLIQYFEADFPQPQNIEFRNKPENFHLRILACDLQICEVSIIPGLIQVRLCKIQKYFKRCHSSRLANL